MAATNSVWGEGGNTPKAALRVPPDGRPCVARPDGEMYLANHSALLSQPGDHFVEAIVHVSDQVTPEKPSDAILEFFRT